MKNNELANRIKNHRTRKGYSQEELAEKTGLSLRTIQRIENGESEPRGDSLKRLAKAFEVTPDEMLDWDLYEDKGSLIGFNLSALSFFVFPILGILVPLIIWISKKDKIQNFNQIAKSLLNFQITWVIVLFGWYFIFIASVFLFMVNLPKEATVVRVEPSTPFEIFGIIIGVIILYAYNLIFIIINTLRI